MKTLFITILSLFTSATFQAQNKNVKDETKTTTTTITDSNGEKTFVKKENTREVQEIELKEEKPNTLNIETKDSPVVVTSSTKITNPDGTTRTVDVDRSSYYTSNDRKYMVKLDDNGYRIIGDDKKKSAFLRKTSTNSYIYYNGKDTSIGYFDTNGNLVLETYNAKTDSVTYQTYIMVKE